MPEPACSLPPRPRWVWCADRRRGLRPGYSVGPGRAFAPAALALCVAIAWAGEGAASFELLWPDARSAAMLAGELDLTGRSLLADITDPETSPGRPAADAPSGPEGVDASSRQQRADASRDRPWKARLGRRRTATFSGGELYGLAEARGWSALVSLPLGNVLGTASVSCLGGDLYGERSLGLSARWLAVPDTEIEVATRGLGLSAARVSDRWTVTVDVGAIRRLLGRILIGARCCNVTRSEIGGSPIASGTETGLALVLPGLSVRVGVLLEVPFQPATTVGLELELTDWARLRAGAATAPGRLAVGLGIGGPSRDPGAGWPIVDLGWQWHPKLGGSTFVSVRLLF